MPVLTHERVLSELEAEARFAPNAEALMHEVVRRLRITCRPTTGLGFT